MSIQQQQQIIKLLELIAKQQAELKDIQERLASLEKKEKERKTLSLQK